jgi:arginine N-succinyltransferase
VNRIDPFDGGPHFEAQVSEISLVREHRRLKVSESPLSSFAGGASRARGGGSAGPRAEPELLVAAARTTGKIHFRAVRTPARIAGGEIALPARARTLLEVEPGDRVHTIPFD